MTVDRAAIPEAPSGGRPLPDDAAAPSSKLEQLAAQHAPALVTGLVVVGAAVAAVVQGAAAGILVLAGGALVAVIAVLWASLRTLFGETPLAGADAYAIGAPRAEEEQKRAVLRALKDLEFELGVGKISEEDFQALTARYRAEAKRLLRALDREASPRRAEVEALVLARLRKEGLVEPDPKPTSTARADEGEAPAASPGGEACGACGVKNDADAVFCKKCGARIGPVAGEGEPVRAQVGGEEKELE